MLLAKIKAVIDLLRSLGLDLPTILKLLLKNKDVVRSAETAEDAAAHLTAAHLADE